MTENWTEYTRLYNSKLPEHVVLLENGFQTKTLNHDHLVKHGLMGKGMLHFVNGLCALVHEGKDATPADEWNTLELTWRVLMKTYENGELYFYLLHAYGPDAISYSSWVHFASCSTWDICVRVFTDMPTAVLEEYGTRDWKERSRTAGLEGKVTILAAIGKRTDIYGIDSMPAHLVDGIIFGSSSESYSSQNLSRRRYKNAP